MQIRSFSEAVEEADGLDGKVHLLLGNGFSIACRPKLFAYGRLFDEADFDDLAADANKLFEISGTSDFERAIEALRVSATVLALYPDADPDLIAAIESDAQALRTALADVLASKHPENTGAITEAEYQSAREFLSQFDGQIFTVNYDLLLYWSLLQKLEPVVKNDDGFRQDQDDPDAEWVTWDGFAGHAQRVYYLHGGLHLYDAGAALKKITWKRTGVPLVEQIRTALAANVYPHVVTEGSSEEKLARIEHSPYLHKGLKSLTSLGGTLFVYGHSLADNDRHVFSRVEHSKVHTVYVSLHGDPSSEGNKEIEHRASLMIERRARLQEGRPVSKQRPLSVKFYAAESANVWN